MKKLFAVVAAAGLLVGTVAQAEEVTSSDSAAKTEKLKLKKKAKKTPTFSFPIQIWQGWGYQTENPHVSTSFYFVPRWTMMKDMSLSAFLGMTVEYTKPDDGRRVYWGNMLLGYNYNFWKPKVGKHKFRFGVGISMTLPTDEGSRNRGMILNVGPRFRFAWTYGILSLSAMVAIQKFWNSSTVAQVVPGPDDGTVSGNPPSDKANLDWQIMTVAGLNLAFTKKLYFATQLWLVNALPYRFGSPGDGFTSPNAVSDANRDSYWLFGEIGYQFNKLFSLGLGFSLSASQLSPGSQWPYLPFNNYNNNFITYVSATVSPSF